MKPFPFPSIRPFGLALAASLLFQLPSAAQTTSPQPEEVAPTGPVEVLNTFKITGMRRGLMTAIEEKRRADVSMDSISSEDVGKFPDQNLAESLQRVAGVMIERTRGEGSRVSVRGLDPKFNSVKFNGRTLTTASSDGRDFNFLLLQPEFVGALEVFKTSSADMEEGALSATINARTLRPLDIGNRRIVLNLEGGYEENAKEVDPRATVLFSNTFNEGKLGVLVGVGYQRRRSETHQFQGFGFENANEVSKNLDYTQDGTLAGSTRIEHAAYFNAIQPDRDRVNSVAVVQFKPSDRLEVYFDGLYARFKETSLGNDNALRFTSIVPNGLGAVQSSTIEMIDGEPYAVRLDADGVDLRNNNRDFQVDERTFSVAAGFKWNNGDRLKIDGEVARSESRQLFSSLGLEVIGRASAAYDVSGDPAAVPSITYQRGFDPFDPIHFNAVGFNGEWKQPRTDESTDLRLDVHYDTGWNFFNHLDAGVKFASRERNNGSRFLSVSAQDLAAQLGETYLPDVEGGAFNAAAYMARVVPSSRFLSAASSSGAIPGTWLSYSPSALAAKLSTAEILATHPLTSFQTRMYSVQEDVAAAYLRANFKGKVGAIPYQGNIGVRVAQTRQTSTGYAPDFAEIVFSQQGATTSVPNSTFTEYTRDYTNVLPSLNIIFNFPNKVDLRLAAARVLSRPDLGQLSTGTSINGNVLSIQSNNPDLDPYLADQFDVSVDKYFGRGGLFTVAGFYKDIRSFIEQATTRETYNVRLAEGGGTIPLTFTRFLPSNGAGAQLYGAEVGYQQQFTFLPHPWNGFGLITNYTYVNSSDITPVAGGPALALTGVSRDNYNIVAYYENTRFSARLAYNFRDKFLVDPRSYFGDGENVSSFRTLDATVNFNFGSRYTLTLNATNLTDEVQTRTSNAGFLRLLEDNGRRFVVSLRATF